jgi:anti-anti-sigma factor
MASQLLLSFTATNASLHLIGELDLAQRRALRRRVVEAVDLCGQDLQLDASKVTFVDCGSLWELDRARQELARRGGRLTVRAASPIFRKVALLADYPELVPEADDDVRLRRHVIDAGPLPPGRKRRVQR